MESKYGVLGAIPTPSEHTPDSTYACVRKTPPKTKTGKAKVECVRGADASGVRAWITEQLTKFNDWTWLYVEREEAE